MTTNTIAVDPEADAFSGQPQFLLDNVDVFPVVSAGAVVFIGSRRTARADLEAEAFTRLAEAAFAEDWDSDADAIYDGM
jgi:hypothetical protein